MKSDTLKPEPITGPATEPKPIPSPWGHETTVDLHLFPYKWGDGAEHLIISFYAAPELCFLIHWTSTLPAELDAPERYRTTPEGEILSFRDVIPFICETLPDHFPKPMIPDFRRAALLEEITFTDGEDPDALVWDEIIAQGMSWTHTSH